MEASELEKLVRTYAPNGEVLEKLARISLVGTVGPTASGKTTAMETAIASHGEPKLRMVLSDVSRAPRPGEIDGKNYFFRDKDAMIAGIKDGVYVQVALMPDGGIYTTRPESYPDGGMGTMAIMSHVVEIFRRLPFKELQWAFIVPHSYEAWQKYLSAQVFSSQWSDEQLKSRLAEARTSFEFALADSQMRFVLNDSPQKAGGRLLQVARGETPDEEKQARTLAEAYLKRLVV